MGTDRLLVLSGVRPGPVVEVALVFSVTETTVVLGVFVGLTVVEITVETDEATAKAGAKYEVLNGLNFNVHVTEYTVTQTSVIGIVIALRNRLMRVVETRRALTGVASTRLVAVKDRIRS